MGSLVSQTNNTCSYVNLGMPSLFLSMRLFELISSMSTNVLSSQRPVSSEPETVKPLRPCNTLVLSNVTVSPRKCNFFNC